MKLSFDSIRCVDLRLMVGVLASAALVLAACGPSGRGNPGGDDDVDGSVSSCTSGQNTCVGNEVHACDNGQPGGLVMACDQGTTCQNGACTTASDCGASGVQLVYVVDINNQLWRFDPTNDANTFTLVGTLNCSATNATPFSMSVDRDAVAWVLYSDGGLYKVSTQNASCTASSWQPGSGGFTSFGMGFVSDSAGSTTEHLAVASSDGGSIAMLGTIAPGTLVPTTIGTMESNGELTPELTGTGAGELYAYYPGSNTFVAKVDQQNPSTNVQHWTLPSLGVDGVNTMVVAWAFAQWGGRFYIFVTIADMFGAGTSKVVRLDPTTGDAPTIIEDSAHEIVGAGVSTCAPITVGRTE